MSARPPHARRNIITSGEVVAGATVRGPTWQSAAHLSNWNVGRGMQVVPHYSPVVTLTTATHEFVWRVKGSIQCIERMWTIQAVAVQDPGSIGVKVPTGGTAQNIYFGADLNQTTPQSVREELTTQTAAEGSLTMAMIPTSNVVIRAIGGTELPRPSLETDTTDRGLEVTDFNPGAWIGDDALANLVSNAANDDVGRRVLLQWAVPYSVAGSTSTAFAASIASGTTADIFELPIPVLARKLGRSATTGTITMKVFHWSSDGAATTGTVYMNSSVNGQSTGVAVGGSTTPAWSNADTLTVDCEDLTVADGRQSSAWDELDVEWQRDTGTGTLYIASISIWED